MVYCPSLFIDTAQKKLKEGGIRSKVEKEALLGRLKRQVGESQPVVLEKPFGRKIPKNDFRLTAL